MAKKKIEIPTTQLRNLYSMLHLFSADTQLSLLNDFLKDRTPKKDENPNQLVQLFKDAVLHFSKYENSGQSFMTDTSRKELEEGSNPKGIFENTNDVIYHFQEIMKTNNEISIPNATNLNFKYLEREVSPLRTTGAEFDTGKPGRSSGGGGLDFIALNNDGYPILGEVKRDDDQNAFYALIQLLTYCSELATESQVARLVNDTKLLNGHKLAPDTDMKFYLYVIFADYNFNNKSNKKLYNATKKLAEIVKQRLDIIEDIVFLEFNKSDMEMKKL